MKSWLCHDEILANCFAILCSDEIFSLRLQMKLNPPPYPAARQISSRSDFIHRRWIYSADGGFSLEVSSRVFKSALRIWRFFAEPLVSELDALLALWVNQMKSWLCHDEILANCFAILCSDEIFSLRLQMKLNPPPYPAARQISSRSDFIHRRWIYSADGGFS